MNETGVDLERLHCSFWMVSIFFYQCEDWDWFETVTETAAAGLRTLLISDNIWTQDTIPKLPKGSLLGREMEIIKRSKRFYKYVNI